MGKLSVVIPACNEVFLQRTIDDILNKSRGEIEVIAYLDGYWPSESIVDDPRVKLIHSEKLGMRNAINSAIRIATGKYIMKTDAHCIFGEGFDEILKRDSQEDWLQVPRRYALDDVNWVMSDRYIDYMYLSPPLKAPEGCSGIYERGYHGVKWDQWNGNTDKSKIMIDDLMSFQGSCWFMEKGLYNRIGCMEIGKWGWFAQEAQELGNKVWLSGGRVVVNKNTCYAHLHKGKKYGRGYFISRDDCDQSAKDSIRIWMNNEWPQQKHDMKWLIDKFTPVPGWENFDWSYKWE